MQSNDMEVMPAVEINDRFSWKRVWMVMNYWWPLLRWKLLTFFLLSAVSAFAAVISFKTFNNYTMLQLTGVSTYICIFGSSVFGKKAGRQMNVALPARNSEKLTFLLIYNLVILPLVSIVPCSLASMLAFGQMPEEIYRTIISAAGIGTGHFSNLYWPVNFYSTLLMLVASMVCLWTATTARNNAFGKAIIFSLLTFICPSFLSGILMGLEAFAEFGDAAVNLDTDTMLSMLFHNAMVIFSILAVLLTIVWIICLSLFIRNFNKRQC